MNLAAALYVHVPFCLRKCPYCDFYSTALRSSWLNQYLEALQRELELRLDALASPIRTVYFGGGTPSLLPPTFLRNFLERLRQERGLAAQAEVTLECNPSSTLTEGYFESLLEAGINRVSIGVQSFHDLHLRTLGRLHTANEGRVALRRARRAGFGNVSVDLIYGIPNQRLSEFREDVLLAVDEGAVHISVYELTLEEGTRFDAWARKGQLTLPREERVAEFFAHAHELLTSLGFEHYEVSNYAKSGFRCRHNVVYWRRQPYVGLGPSAHSFDGKIRSWNVRDVRTYCGRLAQGRLPTDNREALSPKEAISELIFLGLRTSEGIELEAFRSASGEELLPDRLRSLALNYPDYLELSDGHIRPTLRGLMVADDLAARLLRELESEIPLGA